MRPPGVESIVEIYGQGVTNESLGNPWTPSIEWETFSGQVISSSARIRGEIPQKV